MPPRKRKAEQEIVKEEIPQSVDDIEVPALPEALPEDIPLPPIESPSQDMGALAAAAAAAVAVNQPHMSEADIVATARAASNSSGPVPKMTIKVPSSRNPPSTVSTTSRKEKSLAVLCLSFMAVARNTPFSPEGMKIIEIQQIAEQLGAKRRRIYDIINILESIMIVSRVKKNTYQWHGMDGLPAMFAVLQKEGLEEMAAKEAEAAAAASGAAKLPDGSSEVADHLGLGGAETSKPDSMDDIPGKKTKGVARTCKKFFQIFLCNGQSHVAVSDAANIIEGPLTPQNQKALTRRIYDIANVLQSCGIIEKYNVGSTSDTNKPGFRWSYQVSAEDMSKYLPEGHGEALPFNTWSVPIGPNPTLDNPAPEPLADPVMNNTVDI